MSAASLYSYLKSFYVHLTEKETPAIFQDLMKPGIHFNTFQLTNVPIIMSLVQPVLSHVLKTTALRGYSTLISIIFYLVLRLLLPLLLMEIQ